MIDHILEHLHLANEYAANAARIRAVNKRSKRMRELARRCAQAADRERAEALSHAKQFGIDPLVLKQENATWRRRLNYPPDRVDTLTLADVRWLRTVVRYGRCGSRNVRRATELLYLMEAVLGQRGEE